MWVRLLLQLSLSLLLLLQVYNHHHQLINAFKNVNLMLYIES